MEMSAALLEELLEKRQRADDEPVFHVDNCKIVVTHMCHAAVIQHLQALGTQLGSYHRTTEFFELDARDKEKWKDLVSPRLS